MHKYTVSDPAASNGTGKSTQKTEKKGKKEAVKGKMCYSITWNSGSVYSKLQSEEKMMIPQDPVMLMSWLNTKLRDEYGSLSLLCEELDLPEEELKEKLAKAGFTYSPESNQIR